MEEQNLPSDTSEEKKPRGKWKKYAAVGAFLFFLIKGLLWLVGIYFGAQIFGC
ncbi:MAG: hypothetical protein MUC87_04905 [Bacteroidia bacterium]|jgi:hypothetical protein|nr:hypothetical protein [Bacteroidia bacterium]